MRPRTFMGSRLILVGRALALPPVPSHANGFIPPPAVPATTPRRRAARRRGARRT